MRKKARLPSIPLEADLAAQLEAYCKRTGSTKTGAVLVALRNFLFFGEG